VRHPRPPEVTLPGRSPVLPEMGPSPVFSQVGVPVYASVAADARVNLLLGSGSGRLAALAKILAADAIGGSSYNEYF
jgi:hypothetical protein